MGIDTATVSLNETNLLFLVGGEQKPSSEVKTKRVIHGIALVPQIMFLNLVGNSN